MHREKPISETYEMYLKTLYSVRSGHEVAHVRDIAAGLGVRPATVSGVLKKLAALQLVEHEPYGVVALTEAGTRIAECVIRRFETVRDMLIEVLGVDPETAEVDACMMEHGVSPQTVNRMRAKLAEVRGKRHPLASAAAERVPPEACSDCEAQDVCQAAQLLS